MYKKLQFIFLNEYQIRKPYKQILINNKMKKSLVLIIVIVIIVLVVVAAVVGYLYYSGFFNHRQGRFPGGNFQLSQSQIDDVTSFFNSNPSQTSMMTYCQQNRMNCLYYCRNINTANTNCAQMMNFTRQGNFTRGNYTGNYTRRQGGMPPMPQPSQ